MSGLKYREEHKVKTFECDIQKEMTMPALINVMLETSGMQSHLLGNTDDQMSDLGLSWIIIQYHIQVNRMPRRSESLIIETEALSYNRFFTYRVFRAFDQEENLLVEVLTTFGIMEMETRKLTRIQPELVAPYQAEEIRTMVRQPKIEPVQAANSSEQPFRVRYLDIDGNKHVNNSKYFDWMVNTIDMDFHSEHRVKSVTIKYEKEVGYGNMISSRMSQESLEDGTIRTAHEIVNGGGVACVANMIWEKR